MRQHNGDSGQRDLRPLRLLSLLEGTLVEHISESSLLVASRWGDFRLDSPGADVRELISRMALGPVVPDNAVSPAQGLHREWAWAEVSSVLRELECCVVHSLSDGSTTGPFLSVEPVAFRARFALPERLQERTARLSQFTVIRLSGERLLMESPLAMHRVVLHRPEVFQVVDGLTSEATVADTAAALTSLPPRLVVDTVAYLVAAGVAVVGEYDPQAQLQFLPEDTDPRLEPWSPHDLLFHTHRRPRLLDGSALGPPSNLAQPQDGRQLALPPPGGLDTSRERRGRVRFRPLSAAELSELLSRALACSGREAGVPSSFPESGAGVTLYVTLDRSLDVERGIYRYSADRNELILINSHESDIAKILDCAKLASGVGHRPAALFTVTARMSDVPRLFEDSPYSTALLMTGALQERLRNAARELELAASVLTSGDTEITTQALGLDGLAETAIGEFGAGG
ncbi:hypothetical protein RIF23_10855 [Lipingzhangella sp. LS1_29]|uniref:Cyanobactin oxidase ThcOx second domain-containing protein n=1 Tax=Lipingzhangella rawalii TaxID=2055835 RepID=A0ABU2H7L6_9ACTN|nr:hypothetical protein [Lipingzhangella rawalii]MDS1270800.1 hypothetical protein [Lipingzhangella rawalii]